MIEETGNKSAAGFLKERINAGRILPLIGVYDVFSAKIAARYFDGIFCSGFSLSASLYGLPDIGYIGWRDMVEFASRIRCALPDIHLVVDIEDGFGDGAVAATVVHTLEKIGVSAALIEDQKRPRRCGHFSGKQLLEIDEFSKKLRAIKEKAKDICVIARSDADDPREALRRVMRYAHSGADAVLIDAVRSLAAIERLALKVNSPIVVNQLYGGKTPSWSLKILERLGVAAIIYSTPCLFSAQRGLERYLGRLKAEKILPSRGTATMNQCIQALCNK